MSNVTFNVGDHSSFTEGVGAEGSLNFLLYTQSALAVPILNNNGKFFSVGTARLIPIQMSEDNTFHFIENSEKSSSILYDMLNYRIIPYLLDATNFIIYTFSHQDSDQNLVWVNMSIKKSLKISASPSKVGVVKDEDFSTTWIDF